MANPHQTDAHLRLAHSILEQITVTHFTEHQLRMLLLILRLSWGCGKKEAVVPLQKDFTIVGVPETHIKTHLDFLINAKVIIREGNAYSFNKDYDDWRVSRALVFTPEKLTELVSINLNHSSRKGKSGEDIIRKNLPKRESLGYQKGKSSAPKLVSPKETIKESSSSNNSSSKKIPITSDEIADIATLYTEEIGKITTMVAEGLRDAVQLYPAQDIKDAIKIAATGEKRNWRYVLGILENWKRDGRDDINPEPSSSPLEHVGGRSYVITKICRAKETGPDEFRGKSDQEIFDMAKELGVVK